MALFNKVFSTRTLVLIACVLGGVLFMKGLGAYYLSVPKTLSELMTR